MTEGQGRWATEVLNPMAHVHAGAPSLAVNTGGIRRPRSQVLLSVRWARVGRSLPAWSSSSLAASIQALASSLLVRRLAEVGFLARSSGTVSSTLVVGLHLCNLCVRAFRAGESVTGAQRGFAARTSTSLATLTLSAIPFALSK